MLFSDVTVVTVQFLCAGVSLEAGCLAVIPRKRRGARISGVNIPIINHPMYDFSLLLADMTRDDWQITNADHMVRKNRGSQNSSVMFCLRRCDDSVVFDPDYLGAMRYAFQMLVHKHGWQVAAYKYVRPDADDGTIGGLGLHLVFRANR